MTSPRQIAAELGITPAYLSYMVNGRRPWREDLYERYRQLVNTSVNSEGQDVNKNFPKLALADTKIVVGGSGLEPLTSAMSTQCSNQLS